METGLDVLLREPTRFVRGRVGLIANPATVNKRLEHVIDLLHAHPSVELRRLFGPEHGVRSAAQDMEAVEGGVDSITGLPEVSLYGKTFDSLSPTPEQLEDIDTLIFDVQDVGARYYTYAATMALAMRVAGKTGMRFVVLDRPNPIGGAVEGGGLEEGLENFCGLFPVPQRHGLSVGELARLYQRTFGCDCELEVVHCEGWRREQYFDETDLPWVLPSPNMPTLDTAIVYPGTCLFEGTMLSEGRGTTKPLEVIGAPYIDAPKLQAELNRLDLPGVVFRAMSFIPMFQKLQGQVCHGVQIHVTSRSDFMAYRTGLAVIAVLKRMYPDDFEWRTTPYEFRDDVPAIDLLTGIPDVRVAIDEGKDLDDIYTLACQGTDKFLNAREEAVIYR